MVVVFNIPTQMVNFNLGAAIAKCPLTLCRASFDFGEGPDRCLVGVGLWL